MPLYERADPQGPLRQCEILTGLPVAFVNLEALAVGELRVDSETYPYAVVVNQDCDLVQDHAAREAGTQDKRLPYILLLPAVPFEQLRAGLGRDIWRRIANNKDERYQALQSVPAQCDAFGEGLPALGVDFKRCFTVRVEELLFRIQNGDARRRARLTTPWAEHMSARFAHFYCRVALPQDHDMGI